MDRTTAQKMISDASNLDELLAVLREIEEELAESQDDGALYCRVDEMVDVTSLPTYGGAEPNDTFGIWSWDEGRILAGEGSWAECTICERDEDED